MPINAYKHKIRTFAVIQQSWRAALITRSDSLYTTDRVINAALRDCWITANPQI